MSASAMRSLYEPVSASGKTPQEKLAAAIEHAVVTPSEHNWRPWRFELKETFVDLFADYERASTVVDPHGRELVINCGAALFHLKLALKQFGALGRVELFPMLDQPDLLARVHHGGNSQRNPIERGLFEAMAQRDNRRTSPTREISETTLNELKSSVNDDHATLDLVQSEAGRQRIIDFTVESERRLMADPEVRREYAMRVRVGDQHSVGAAVRISLGRLPGSAGPLVSWVVKTLDRGDRSSDRRQELAANGATLAILKTKTDEQSAWLAAGQAMARVLLTAKSFGAEASVLNQAVQCHATRSQLRTEMGRKGFPQVILRLGLTPGINGNAQIVRQSALALAR